MRLFWPPTVCIVVSATLQCSDPLCSLHRFLIPLYISVHARRAKLKTDTRASLCSIEDGIVVSFATEENCCGGNTVLQTWWGDLAGENLPYTTVVNPVWDMRVWIIIRHALSKGWPERRICVVWCFLPAIIARNLESLLLDISDGKIREDIISSLIASILNVVVTFVIVRISLLCDKGELRESREGIQGCFMYNKTHCKSTRGLNRDISFYPSFAQF